VFARRRLEVEAERDGPASSILARGYVFDVFEGLRRTPCLPMRSHSGCRWIRPWNATSRLQWRHRVGFSPTSRDTGQNRCCDCTGSTSIVRRV